MELALRNGDYLSDGAGGLRRAQGKEALLQRVMFRLTAKRGSFPFWEDLGSRLWQLSQLPMAARQAAAKQYVTEALAGERGVYVEQVTLVQTGDRAELTTQMIWQGETLAVTVEIQM